jgi:hypothetical protein
MKGTAPPASRLAVIGTPASGNQWVSGVLSRLLGVSGIQAAHPADVEWSNLPDPCVLTLSWERTRALRAMLHEGGFLVVSPARHPFDVLLDLFAAEPEGRESFLDWAGSEGVGRGLEVTAQWWSTPSTARVRYEALCADPGGAFPRLFQRIGRDPSQPISLEDDTNGRRHGGRPLGPEEVERLLSRYHTLLTRLGYR